MRFLTLIALFIATSAGADDLVRDSAHSQAIYLGIPEHSPYLNEFVDWLSSKSGFIELVKGNRWNAADDYAQSVFWEHSLGQVRRGQATVDHAVALHSILIARDREKNPPVRRDWRKPGTWFKREKLTEERRLVRDYLRAELQRNPAGFGRVRPTELEAILPRDQLRKRIRGWKPEQRMKYFSDLYTRQPVSAVLEDEYVLYLERMQKNPLGFKADIAEGLKNFQSDWPKGVLNRYAEILEDIRKIDHRTTVQFLRDLQPTLAKIPLAERIRLKWGAEHRFKSARTLLYQLAPTFEQVRKSVDHRDVFHAYLAEIRKDPKEFLKEIVTPPLSDFSREVDFYKLFANADAAREYARAVVDLTPLIRGQHETIRYTFAKAIARHYPHAFDFEKEAAAAKKAKQELLAIAGEAHRAGHAPPMLDDDWLTAGDFDPPVKEGPLGHLPYGAECSASDLLKFYFKN